MMSTDVAASLTQSPPIDAIYIPSDEYYEYCHHSPMLKTAQFTSYRLTHKTPSYYRPAITNLSRTQRLQNIHSTASCKQGPGFKHTSEDASRHKDSGRIQKYKMAGNREDKVPKHEMVHFEGLLNTERRFAKFRTVLHTGLYSQLVAMEVPVNGEIGDEVHTVDQILLFTSGRGLATVAGKDQEVKAGDVVVVPAGTQHQFVTRGDQPLELITVYSPAEHDAKTVHKTKEEGDEEEDNGKDEAPEWSQKSKKENEDAGLVKESGKYD
ncbi:RmlC-like cupin [Lophiostoma macrostomum CBS 122681]|uniref:RmlC-like cupin n=1 Tax=Lophiostoma macrostomum CBS 122681 TaxID=1314788 RepID=A0A6A6T9X7_9PLEO|nr:RmlC-like cupin [Lophiostoma macrostomum CBS 122681]